MLRSVILSVLVLVGLAAAQTKPPETIVFVCEHGAAKSVVAAAYFNKLAKEQHLNIHAIARGTNPQPDVSAVVAQGLHADGVKSETKRPQPLSDPDVQGASRIVAFCPVPEKYAHRVPVENWNDVPGTSEGYAAVRDAVLKHLRSLLETVKASAKGR